MGRALRVGFLVAAGVAVCGMLTFAQAPGAQAPATGAWVSAPVVNDLPNPYNTIEGWAKLPEGRTWGSTSAVDVDRDGKSIWVAERCAVNSCCDIKTNEMSPLNTVFKFDPNGKMVAQLRPGHVRVPARHPRRSRRQHLGHRRPGQPAAPASGPGGRRADAAGARQDRRAPGGEVQPAGQGAVVARQAGRQCAGAAAGSGVVLSAERRDHVSERRHPRGGRATATRTRG